MVMDRAAYTSRTSDRFPGRFWWVCLVLQVSALLCPPAGLGVEATAITPAQRRRRVEAVAVVQEYPYRPWSQAYTYESRHYRVKTNTSAEVATYIGQLMDFAQQNYRRVFGYDESIPRLPIHAYRTDREYQQVARAVGLGGSAGFFSQNGGDRIIHLAYTKTYGLTQPTRTLLHEGAHQFLSFACSFPIPARYRQHFVEGMDVLPSLPLWLNEGIATYFEAARYDGTRLVVGELNSNRLRQLQGELRDGRAVTLEKLFTTHDPKRFGASHYAAAWGMVYWFRHDAAAARRRAKRRILKAYMLECRRGFFRDPERDFEALLEEDFTARWQAHVARQSYATLLEMTIGKDGVLAKWERVWRDWILALDPTDPSGGLDSRADEMP